MFLIFTCQICFIQANTSKQFFQSFLNYQWVCSHSKNVQNYFPSGILKQNEKFVEYVL
jgi:hypothetical protein